MSKTKETKALSRREFLRDAGLVAGGAAIGSAMLLNACAKATTETVTVTGPGTTKTATVTGPGSTVMTTVTTPGAATTKTVSTTMTTTVTQNSTITVPATTTAAAKMTVLNPCGTTPKVTRVPMAPRKANLTDYGTIYIVDITFSGTYELAACIKQWFTTNMPNLKVVVTKEIGSYLVADEDTLWKQIKAANGAVIMCGGH
jgi:hypothetical protein